MSRQPVSDPSPLRLLLLGVHRFSTVDVEPVRLPARSSEDSSKYLSQQPVLSALPWLTGLLQAFYASASPSLPPPTGAASAAAGLVKDPNDKYVDYIHRMRQFRLPRHPEVRNEEEPEKHSRFFSALHRWFVGQNDQAQRFEWFHEYPVYNNLSADIVAVDLEARRTVVVVEAYRSSTAAVEAKRNQLANYVRCAVQEGGGPLADIELLGVVLDVEESRFDLFAYVRAVDRGKLTQILLVPHSSDLGGLLRALQWWFRYQSRPDRVPFHALVLEDGARLVKVSPKSSSPLVSATAAAVSASAASPARAAATAWKVFDYRGRNVGLIERRSVEFNLQCIPGATLAVDSADFQARCCVAHGVTACICKAMCCRSCSILG